jgi:TatD DNase family protein
MIDIGLNIGSDKFNNDVDLVLNRGLNAGVSGYIFTGTSLQNTIKTKIISEKNKNISRFTAGVHPHNAKTWNNVHKEISVLAEHPLCVSVGECGLDYDRMFSTEIEQKDALVGHMDLALKLNKPLFLHIRGIDGDIKSEKKILADFKEIYSPYKDKGVKGVVHCFTMGSRSMEALKALDLYFGITGWVCDEKRGKVLQEVVKYIPNNRIMIETDAPYLTPPEARKLLPVKGRNEPMFLNMVLDKVAKIKNKNPNELNEIMNENIKNLFNLTF